MRQWQLQEAKAKFSELVRASEEGPQEITVRGKTAAVILSKADYDRLKRKKPSFVELIRNSPLMGVKLDLRRDKSPAREVKL
jgi:antitoxin Phd